MKSSKLGNKRDADVEIDQLKRKCTGLESQVAASFNHKIELGKESQAYKIKCEGLSAELQRNGMELENLQGVINGFSQERQGYRIKCTELEEKIKGLMEEQGTAMSERETRICHLEEVIQKMESTNERERFTEMETRILKLQEENATLKALQNGVSGEKTCREMDGMVDVEAQLIVTETSPNSIFTPCCKCSSLQVNSNGVHDSGDAPPVNYQRDYLASAVGSQMVFETERTLTRFRKCSGTPSGARPSTTCIVELVDISEDEGET